MDDARKELLARQRAHWMEMGRAKADFDKLDEVIDHLDNFTNMAQNLRDNSSDAAFERWFEKLYRLDKRALIFYILAHRTEITEVQFDFAKKYFDERDKIDWKLVEKLLNFWQEGE